MEKFYFEIPSIDRKEDAIEYINEYYQYNSEINGSGGLDRFLDNYDGWLDKLEKDYNAVPNEERVPARTYFLIRERDNRIVGMINIRTALNERLRKFGGNIGYGIRPSERGNGYNKINLYRALEICDWHGLESVVLDCAVDNPASERTMIALGGNLISEYIDPYDNELCHRYEINVSESLENYRDIYGQYDNINIRR